MLLIISYLESYETHPTLGKYLGFLKNFSTLNQEEEYKIRMTFN